MSLYIGVSEVAHKVTGICVGTNGIARKVLKGYIGDTNGVARQFYAAYIPITYIYTGTCTESEVTIDGELYTVLTLTSSGTLSIDRPISADVWLCGGGANGRESPGTTISGGGGGGGYVNTGTLEIIEPLTVSVPSAQGYASIGGLTADPGEQTYANLKNEWNHGGNGGSGGGEGGSNTSGSSGDFWGGLGERKTTVPSLFGITDRHCAGGGGGQVRSGFGSYINGGAGGSNGRNGSEKDSSDYDLTSKIASGGNKGGGKGGGGHATYYGGGGGGEDYRPQLPAGSGYQGVVYIRWKKENAA